MNTRERARRLVELDEKASNRRDEMMREEWSELAGLTHSFSMVPEYARKLIEALDVLERIEWAGSDEFESPWRECPICGASKQKRQHKPGCEIGALLHGEKEDGQS